MKTFIIIITLMLCPIPLGIEVVLKNKNQKTEEYCEIYQPLERWEKIFVAYIGGWIVQLDLLFKAFIISIAIVIGYNILK